MKEVKMVKETFIVQSNVMTENPAAQKEFNA